MIGDGRERRRLERNARGYIRFLGFQPAAVVRQAIQTCRALVFPGGEDFGMVMAKAQACGRPIVAFDRGDASEVVNDSVTGVLFEKQTPDSLCDALPRCEKKHFDSVAIRAYALRFNVKRFRREFSQFVERAIESSSLTKHACEGRS